MKEKINSTLQSDISALGRSKAAITGLDLMHRSGAHHDLPQKMISSAVGDIQRELQVLGDSTEGSGDAKLKELQRETNIARARGLARADAHERAHERAAQRARREESDVAVPRGLAKVEGDILKAAAPAPAPAPAPAREFSALVLDPIEKAAEAMAQAQRGLRARMLESKLKRYQLRLMREATACWEDMLDQAALQVGGRVQLCYEVMR
jgi:hypothetical protein